MRLNTTNAIFGNSYVARFAVEFAPVDPTLAPGFEPTDNEGIRYPDSQVWE
jgi:hypothetical protein